MNEIEAITEHLTLCDVPDCGLCRFYEYGYSQGKEKAYFEFSAWDASHAVSCGCEPCTAFRSMLRAYLERITSGRD